MRIIDEFANYDIHADPANADLVKARVPAMQEGTFQCP
jgi:hypothetical protein